MGAGSGNNELHDSIVITNHTHRAIDIVSIGDSSVADNDRKKTYTIGPKDSYVIFTSRVEALSWEKQKQG